MSLPDRNTLVYAGIGSRQTPAATLNDMTTMSAWLARNGWHLSSGGADGGDKAFALGANSDERTVYLPWSGYNKLSGPNCITREGACENGGRERGCRSGMLHGPDSGCELCSAFAVEDVGPRGQLRDQGEKVLAA